MLRYTHPFPIYINPDDPAAAVIGADLTALGGIPSEKVPMVYGFPSGRKRDAAMGRIRGVYGSRSVASTPNGWLNMCEIPED